MDKFGYIMISAGLFPVWLFIYVKAQRLRKRIRNFGIYGGLVGIITEPLFFIQDYWNPPPLSGIKNFHSLEDFLYMFFISGISISLYNFIFNIHYHTEYKKHKKMSIVLVVLALSSFLLTIFFDWNSLFVSVAALIIISSIMIFIRKDLFVPALTSAILITLIAFIVYTFLFNVIFTSYWQHYWRLADSVYAYYIFNVPWTEYLWYFTLGLFGSIVYDFASGTAKNVKLSSK